LGHISRRERSGNTRSGLARASNAERWPKRFQPFGLHSKEAGGCVGAAVTAQGGCSCVAALPSEEEEGNSGGWRAGEPASFECNKCLSNLISGSPTASSGLGLMACRIFNLPENAFQHSTTGHHQREQSGVRSTHGILTPPGKLQIGTASSTPFSTNRLGNG
jgi:hypothetical protein